MPLDRLDRDRLDLLAISRVTLVGAQVHADLHHVPNQHDPRNRNMHTLPTQVLSGQPFSALPPQTRNPQWLSKLERRMWFSSVHVAHVTACCILHGYLGQAACTVTSDSDLMGEACTTYPKSNSAHAKCKLELVVKKVLRSRSRRCLQRMHGPNRLVIQQHVITQANPAQQADGPFASAQARLPPPHRLTTSSAPSPALPPGHTRPVRLKSVHAQEQV